MTPSVTDWDPEAYGRFRGLRLRPALDLLARIGSLPDGDIVDLGCGDGAAGPALALRFPTRAVIGVDASPGMLAKAAESGAYARLLEADVGAWQPDAAVALIYSNAVLHWLGDHDHLLPRLAATLAPEGVLAVQMPRQFAAPSHRFLRDIAASLFPETFDFSSFEPPVRSPETYWRLLSPLGEVEVWETDYLQRLEPTGNEHPVRRFTESTVMRPFLQKLDEGQTAAFLASYDQALSAAYPLLEDGAVLFPFRRLFLTLKV